MHDSGGDSHDQFSAVMTVRAYSTCTVYENICVCVCIAIPGSGSKGNEITSESLQSNEVRVSQNCCLFQ